MSTLDTTAGPALKRKQKRELLDRTALFGKAARTFYRKTPRTLASMGDFRRLMHASGAIGAHYISADSSESRQEFLRHMSNCKKHSQQAAHYLELLDDNLEKPNETMRKNLAKEASELERIFGAIVGKTINNAKKKEA